MRKMFIFFICVLSILLCSYTSCYEVKESTPDSDTSLDYLSSLENEKVFGFEVIIAINKQVFTEKEEIEVEISLKNNNSFDVGIAYFILFTAIIPTATHNLVEIEMPQYPYVEVCRAGENIKARTYLGGCFDVGLHKIRYKAKFYINWGEERQQEIEVLSNELQIEII